MSAAGEDELSAFRSAAHALVDGVADHLAALPSRPVWQPLPDALREQLLCLPLPEHPAELEELVGTALRDVLPHAMGNGHPAFFGWVNPPPSPAGVITSLAAAAITRASSPGITPTSTSSVRWCAGWPSWWASRTRRMPACSRAAGPLPRSSASRALAAVRWRRAGMTSVATASPAPRSSWPTCRPRPIAACGAPWSSLGSGAVLCASCRSREAGSTRPCYGLDRRRSRERRSAGAARRLGRHREHRRDRPARRARRCRRGGGALVPRRRRLGRVGVLDPAIAARFRGMERADSLVLDPEWLGVPVDSGSRWCGAARTCATRSASSRHTCARTGRRGGRHVRRIRPGADEALPRPQDVGDHRRARTRRHRRPGGARERARPRAGDDRRARTRAGAGGCARDLDRGLPGTPGGLSARQA